MLVHVTTIFPPNQLPVVVTTTQLSGETPLESLERHFGAVEDKLKELGMA